MYVNLSNALILDPMTPFVAIARDLAVLGWQRLVDATEPEPVIAGEPELARWRAMDQSGAITYTFHPATFLRVLLLPDDADASLAKAIEQRLPVVQVDTIRDWLSSVELTTALRGIQAAGVLREPSLIEPLNELMQNPDKLIAREARQALTKVLQRSMRQVQQIREALPPNRQSLTAVSLFASIIDLRERRQVLRWLMHDYRQTNADIHAVLEDALHDSDWELRMTAMLAALRLNDSSLRPLVAKVTLPSGPRDGTDSQDRRILAGLQMAVLALLDGEPAPPDQDEPLTSRNAVRNHLMRCALGLEVSHHDRIFLLVHALAEPVPILSKAEMPQRLPPGVKTEDGLFWLGDQLLIWVPPLLHWLGDELVHAPIENPIHQRKPENPLGFLILSTPEAPQTFAEAETRCRLLASRYGATIRLPTADEWEMAARGPDGRRFPWGNAYTPEYRYAPSVWGISHVAGSVPQWTSDRTAEGVPIICGDTDQLRCSVRKAAGAGVAALRFVVDFPA